MAIAFAKHIGGFVRWLLKGCRTSLQDEMEGNLKATWGSTYDFENYVIGVITVIIIFSMVLWLAF